MFNLAEQFIVDAALIAKANGGSSFNLEEFARQFAEDEAPPAERLVRELTTASSPRVAATAFQRLMESRPPEANARAAVVTFLRSIGAP